MRFGRRLKNSIYPPWSDKYIDYDKLKKLLREPASVAGSPVDDDDGDEWTEEDEGAFVEELINVQLEKVAAFEQETLKQLQDQTTECEKELEPLGQGSNEIKSGDHLDVPGSSKPSISGEEREKILGDVLKKLDTITKETNELEKFGRINYTGFLKAGKKHDRKRGKAYRVRPLLQVRLSALPFHNEDYSPLLYRLSAMYSFVRQSLDGKDHRGLSFTDSQAGAESYTSYKCKTKQAYGPPR
jgi:SPX domain protein involved in polyphosphate accumulation